MGAFKSNRLFTNEDRPPPLRSTEDKTLPEHIHGYAPICRLGRGGTSDVYLGISNGSASEFRKLVVLKLLQPALRRDPYSVEMFRREARIAARLSHPNTVQTFAIEENDDYDVLVMEYLEGATLSAALRCANRDPSKRYMGPLLGAVCQALSGLHYVHELSDFSGECLQLVHRDVKPGNIFITFNGQVKVLDFGVAKVSARARDATTSTYIKGTAQYMAPELINDAPSVDRRSDLFSAGVVLWEIVHGRRLWGTKTHGEIFRALAMGEIPLSSPGESLVVSPRLDHVCRRALSITPKDRPRSADELRQELLAVLDELRLDHSTETLATMMEEWFGAARRRRSAEINERIETLSPVHARNFASLTEARSLPETGALAETASLHAASLPVESSVSRSMWVPVVAALVLSGGGAALWFRPSQEPDAVHSVAADEAVIVRISAQPSNAEILLDGRVLQGNPVHLERARDEEPHTLVIRAPGYEQRYLELRLDRSRDVDLALVRGSPFREQEHGTPVAAQIASAGAGADDSTADVVPEDAGVRNSGKPRTRSLRAPERERAAERERVAEREHQPESELRTTTPAAQQGLPRVLEVSRLDEVSTPPESSKSRFAPLERRDLKPFQGRP